MGIWDMGTVLTSHPAFDEGLCGTRKGIEEPALGPAKGPVKRAACRDREQ